MAAEDSVLRNEERARERNAKLALDQTALSLRSLALNHWIMPVFTATVCVMFARWIEPLRLAVWFAVVTVSTVPLAMVCRMFRRHKPDASRRQYWVAAAAGSYFVFTAAWASLGFVLWAPNDSLNHMVVLLILASTIAGSSALTSASKPLALVAFATYGTVLVLTPLQQGGAVYKGLSLLAVFFTLYLVYMWRHMHETARDMLLLRNDKDDLIVALARAKTESDEACARAEAANKAKSQFLANMSHELRTPLNAILGFSEIIFTNAVHGDTAKDHDYAKLINKSGHHLLTLINDVLDLAKIEAGGLTLRDAELDLDRIIDEAHALMTPKAEAGGCLLAKEIGASLPYLFADERAVKQVLLNMLSNAVKFTRAGGTVTSFVRVEDDGRIALGVSDTGVGIAKEDQALVFQKFGQGRHDIVTEQGTGLGLPIVKGLVEAHGGSIVLESETGVGTAITARFPAIRARPARLRAAS